MIINPIQALISSAVNRQSALENIPVANTVINSGNGTAQSVDSTELSAPKGQLLESAILRDALLGFSQLSSTLQTAQSGNAKIDTILQNLQNLAQQLTGGKISTGEATSQAQTLFAAIDETTAETANGISNLGGKGGNTSGISSALTNLGHKNFLQNLLANLSSQGLFAGGASDLFAGGGANAAATIENAQNLNKQTRASIEKIFGQAGLASSGVESAIANNLASVSTLSAKDFGGAAENKLLAKLLAKPELAAKAQTGNLTDSLFASLKS